MQELVDLVERETCNLRSVDGFSSCKLKSGCNSVMREMLSTLKAMSSKRWCLGWVEYDE